MRYCDFTSRTSTDGDATSRTTPSATLWLTADYCVVSITHIVFLNPSSLSTYCLSQSDFQDLQPTAIVYSWDIESTYFSRTNWCQDSSWKGKCIVEHHSWSCLIFATLTSPLYPNNKSHHPLASADPDKITKCITVKLFIIEWNAAPCAPGRPLMHMFANCEPGRAWVRP